MKRNLLRNWTSWLMTILILFQKLLGARPLFAEENNEVGPQLVSGEKGTVIYNPDNLFRLYGTKQGEDWSDITFTMILQTDNGETELVFCIEPGVPFSGGIETTDYESVQASNVSHRSQVAAAIWKGVFPNLTVAEQITTQAVIWENLTQYGLDIHEIEGISNFNELKNQLNQAIDEYDEKPTFHNQTIDVVYGEESQLQSGGVNLNLFDTLVENTANLSYDISPDGQLLTLTPTDITKQQGALKFKSSYMEGTPLAFEKEGSQTVMVARIQNTTSYQLNVHIQTLGKVQIQKVDKTTGDPVPGNDTIFGEAHQGVQTVRATKDGIKSVVHIPKQRVKSTTKVAKSSYRLLKNSQRFFLETQKRLTQVGRWVAKFIANPLIIFKGISIGGLGLLIVGLLMIVVVSVTSTFSSVTTKSDELELTKTWRYFTELDANRTIAIQNGSKELEINGSHANRDKVQIRSNINEVLAYLDTTYGDFELDGKLLPTNESTKKNLSSLHQSMIKETSSKDKEMIDMKPVVEVIPEDKELTEQLNGLMEMGQFIGLEELAAPIAN